MHADDATHPALAALDWATPDAPALAFNPEGLPEGAPGERFAEAVLTHLSELVANDGWDQPDTIWEVRTPAASAAGRVTDVDLDVPAGAVMYELRKSVEVAGHYLDYLPHLPRPDAGTAAIVHVNEAWLTVQESGTSNRHQARILALVPRTGEPTLLQVVRDGDTTLVRVGVGGPQMMLLGRLLGRDVATTFDVPALLAGLVWQRVALVLPQVREELARTLPDLAADELQGELDFTTVRVACAAIADLTLLLIDSLAMPIPDESRTLLTAVAGMTDTLERAQTVEVLSLASVVAKRATFTDVASWAGPSVFPERVGVELVTWAGEALVGALLARFWVTPFDEVRARLDELPGAQRVLDELSAMLGWDPSAATGRT